MIQNILTELRATNSMKEKEEILNKYKENNELKNIIRYTYNPYMKYKFSKATLEKAVEEATPTKLYTNIFDVLELLSTSDINDTLRNEVGYFLKNSNERELYSQMILKDLNIGCGIATINKVWKELIPTFKIQLAASYDADNHIMEDYTITEKLDGIRCIAICYPDKVQLYSRSGREIEGCVEVEEAIKDLKLFGHILDGELIAKNVDYKNIYKETTKRVKNKNSIKDGIEFKVFDTITIHEFETKKCNRPYSERRSFLEANLKDNEFVQLIKKLNKTNDQEELIKLLDSYRSKGAEGLMLNINSGKYEFKRSKNILKLKVMSDVDLRVIDVIEGTGRNEGKLGAAIVQYKGNKVRVGSGWSDSDREYYWSNKDEILNKIIKVQYFEETHDSLGNLSLRFPVFVDICDKDEESYF